jgi:hypothetical protein
MRVCIYVVLVMAAVQMVSAGLQVAERFDASDVDAFNAWADANGLSDRRIAIVIDKTALDEKAGTWKYRVRFLGSRSASETTLTLLDIHDVRHSVYALDDKYVSVRARRIGPDERTREYLWQRIYSRKGTLLFEVPAATTTVATAGTRFMFEVPRDAETGGPSDDVLVVRDSTGAILNRIRDPMARWLTSEGVSSPGRLTAIRLGEGAKRVYLLDEVGRVRWRKDFDALVFYAIAPNDSIFAVSSGGLVEVLDNTGHAVAKLNWRKGHAGSVVMAFSDDGRRLAVADRQFGWLAVYDVPTSTELWRAKALGDDDRSIMAMEMWHGLVVVATYDQQIMFLEDGREVSPRIRPSLGTVRLPRQVPGGGVALREVADPGWECSLRGGSWLDWGPGSRSTGWR